MARDEAQLLNRECGKVFLENTFICSLLMRDGDPDVALSYKTDTIKERVQNYLEADMVFLPINIKECHWYLAVVCAKLFEVHVLDSMGLLMFNRDDLKKILKGLERQMKFVLEHNENIKRGNWKNFDVSTWPIIEKIEDRMQRDGTSCGLWMVNFMEYWTGSSLSDDITQDDIYNFRFKLPAILWDSRLNIKNRFQEYYDEDNTSDVEIVDTTPTTPKPSATIVMDRKELMHRLSTYIWSIDDPKCLELLVEEKYHFMDLQFCDISQIGRDPRCCDKIDYKELAQLLQCWPYMCYDVKDCSTEIIRLSCIQLSKEVEWRKIAPQPYVTFTKNRILVGHAEEP